MFNISIKLIFSILFPVTLFAQEPLRKKHFNLKAGIALQGFDPVAYFKQQTAVKGKKEFSVYHAGATYYFSTFENKNEFKKNAAGYEPEFGGWCAYAMGATGEKVSIDPETFKIINGKLYLFYNQFFNNTLKDWNRDEVNLIAKAPVNWAKLFH
jgi:YHS domain-containing protein